MVENPFSPSDEIEMKTRPPALVLVAILQVLFPALGIWVNSRVSGMAPWTLAGLFFDRGPLEVFQFFLLMPLAGVAIYRVRPWSYPVFLGALAWTTAYAFRSWTHAFDPIAFAAFLILALTDFAWATYWLAYRHQAPFVDPRSRWWETKPRFMIRLNAIVVCEGKRYLGEIHNLSEGGAFVRTIADLNPSDQFTLSFTIFADKLGLPCRVVYGLKGTAHGYGVQFVAAPESREALKRLMKCLDILNVERRSNLWSPRGLVDFVTGRTRRIRNALRAAEQEREEELIKHLREEDRDAS